MNGCDEAVLRVSTPLGEFDVRASARGLRAVTLAVERPPRPGGPREPAPAAIRHAQAAADVLRRYARGERVRYEGPLDVAAPAFHLDVWERVRAIPFGATATYGGIAVALGCPGEARVVGAAVGANPIGVLVPCHRVVGADGSLRGYAWGLDLKRRLLAHEGSAAPSLFAEVGPA